MTTAFDRFRLPLIGLVLAATLWGCDKDDPINIYYGMATAAEFGDEKGFIKGFTKETTQLNEAQLSLSESYGLKNENPVTMLDFANVDNVVVEEDRAILDVSRGSSKRKIVMVNVPDVGWRIDVKVLGDFWEDQKKRK
jgi:hypothetical protein